MTKQDDAIVLPVFTDREFTEQFNKHTLELADKLVEAANAWITTFRNSANEDRPSAQAVGAAFYAALWKLSNQSPSSLEAMRQGCATTLLKNDVATRALITLASAQFPELPN